MSAFREIWEAGGPLMYPLGAVCLATWFWIAVLYPKLRRIRGSGLGLERRLHGLSERGVADSLVKWASDHHGSLARMARYALGGERTAVAVRDRLLEARMAELPRFERELRVLRAMVSAAPLLGLLGTVKGMIEAFWALSMRGAATVEQLSSGISEALVTTQVGLVVALPGLVGVYAISRRLAEAGLVIDRLESRLLAALPGRRAHIRPGGSR